MKWPPKISSLVLLAGSSALSLVLAEGYLRINPPYWLYEQTRSIVQQDYSEPSSNSILKYIPKANAKGFFRNREFVTSVQINSKHLRDREHSYEKLKGTRRLIVSGDSFVFGWGVDVSQSLCDLLEHRYLQNVEVLNLGVSGYEIDQQIEWVRTEGVRYDPDFLLFFSYGFPSRSMTEFVFAEGRMYDQARYPNTLKRKIQNFLLHHVYLYGAFIHAYSRLANREADRGAVLKMEEILWQKEIQEVLRPLTEIAGQNHLRVLFLYIPLKSELTEPRDKSTADAMRSLEAFCQEHQWGFLDLTGPLQKFFHQTGKNSYFHYDDHWNALGHEVAAQAIASYLQQNFGL